MNMDTTTYGHQYPELEKRIASKDAELKEEARREGKYFGMQNRPDHAEHSLAPYIGFIKSGYERIKADVLQFLQPDQHESQMKANTIACTEKQAELAVQKARLEHENKVALHELDGKVPEKHTNQSTLGWLFLAVIYLSEIAFNTNSFEFLGDSLLFAFAIACGVSVSMFLLSRGITRFYERGKQEGMRMYLVSGAFFGIAFGLISVLSYWRTKMGGAENTSPVLFIIVNLAFLAASMLISYFYFPKREEQAAERELRTKHDAIKEREAKIKAISEELEQLKETLRKQSEHHEQIISLSEHACRRIEILYRETTEIFKSALIKHRDDRKTPECLNEPIPPLA